MRKKIILISIVAIELFVVFKKILELKTKTNKNDRGILYSFELHIKVIAENSKNALASHSPVANTD